MKITPLIPDQAASPSAAALPDVSAFGKALDRAGAALRAADGAEDAFAAHGGSLQEAVFERAQADVVLSVATAAAQRTAQGVQAILNMQI